jgi:hypothetical protein
MRIAVCLLLCIIAGCSGANVPTPSDTSMPPTIESPQHSGDLTQQGSEELPAIELLDLNLRLTLDVEVSAQDTLLHYGAIVDEGLLWLRDRGYMSWALWGWQVDSATEYPATVQIDCDQISDEYWVALPNFITKRWDISGPYREAQQTVEIDIARNAPVDLSGDFCIVLICAEGNEVRVRSLSVAPGPSGGYPNNLPRRWLTATTDLDAHCRIDWEGELPPGRSLYRRYSWQASSEMEPVHGDGGGEYLDEECTAGKFCYYQLFDELEDGKLVAASPEVLGMRGPVPEGHKLSGRLVNWQGKPQVGEPLYLSFYKLRSTTDAEGRFSFPGLGPRYYELQWVREPENYGLATVLIADDDNDIGDVGLPYVQPPSGMGYEFGPQDFAMKVISADSIELSWTPLVWARSYKVYRVRGVDDWDVRLAGECFEPQLSLVGEPTGVNKYYVEAVSPSRYDSPPSAELSFDSVCSEIYPDSIYCVADDYELAAGDSTTITVYCKETPDPLRSVCLGLSFKSSADYVPNSFNIGAPGGAAYEPDGAWAAMPDLEYLAVPEGFIKEAPDNYVEGNSRFELVVVPLDHEELPLINADGALLNFSLKVVEDTLVQIQRTNIVDATYYSSDDVLDHYFWAHDYNEQMPVIRAVE